MATSYHKIDSDGMITFHDDSADGESKKPKASLSFVLLTLSWSYLSLHLLTLLYFSGWKRKKEREVHDGMAPVTRTIAPPPPEIAVNLEYSNSGTNVRILTLDFSILVIKKIYFVQIRKM